MRNARPVRVRALRYRRTTGAGTALRRARAPVTRFAARAVFAGRAASHAESGFRVARALPVALQHRLGTADQRVAAESGVAAALHPVVDDLTLGARAARRGSVAGRCVQDGSRVTYKAGNAFA